MYIKHLAYFAYNKCVVHVGGWERVRSATKMFERNLQEENLKLWKFSI